MWQKNIPFLFPYVTEKMKRAAYDAMGQKMIGEGKTVADFEKKLGSMLKVKNVVTLNSCSSALELAYHLMNFKPKDEVISSVFTCTITNLALLRRGVKIVFADILENMLLDWDDVKKKITSKTRAIINVHLFNQLSQSRKTSIPIIGDAAQYLGRISGEKFTVYSFQATKIMTTVDGGALVCTNNKDYRRAKLLRWYSINRKRIKTISMLTLKRPDTNIT